MRLEGFFRSFLLFKRRKVPFQPFHSSKHISSAPPYTILAHITLSHLNHSAMSSNNKTTSNNEYDLHPQVNRVLENHGSHGHTPHGASLSATTTSSDSTAKSSAPTGSATCHCGKNEWDLHPACIREIENHGSAKDVKDLHELERHCERAEHKH
jgi:hypothetical protein